MSAAFKAYRFDRSVTADITGVDRVGKFWQPGIDCSAPLPYFCRCSPFREWEKEIDRVTFWGLSDRRTWRLSQHPLIFDANNQRKPAYAAIVDALLHPNPEWMTVP